MGTRCGVRKEEERCDMSIGEARDGMGGGVKQGEKGRQHDKKGVLCRYLLLIRGSYAHAW